MERERAEFGFKGWMDASSCAKNRENRKALLPL